MTIDEAIEHCAEWLEELKKLREIKEEYQKGMDSSYATFMYKKAIDDFAEKIWAYGTYDDYGNVIDVLEIAEELKKEGGKCMTNMWCIDCSMATYSQGRPYCKKEKRHLDSFSYKPDWCQYKEGAE